jgi:hypothetical protein
MQRNRLHAVKTALVQPDMAFRRNLMSIGSCTDSAACAASAANAGTVQGAAALLIQKKAMQQDESSAAQLIAALPEPALAKDGGPGSIINTYA